MTDPKQASADDASSQGDAAMPSRRRLLRGGLAAAPVMLTLASRPVRAGGSGGGCKAASAFTSMTASGHKSDNSNTCAGRSPSFWQSTSQWPSGMKANGAKATQFCDVFPAGSVYPDKSMMEVMNMNGTAGTSGVARYISAAYLNSAARLTPDMILGKPIAISVWSSYISKGYYEPTAGVRWNSDQIIAWLSSTMT